MGKVVLITGCSSGVGLHAAAQFAEAGWVVYASMRNPDRSETLMQQCASLRVKPVVIALDVQNEESIRTAVLGILARHGHIDVLVNNAGFGCVRSLEQASTQEYQEVFDVNVHGVARCIKAVLPSMRERKAGHILAVSSVGGLVGQPMNEIYCAAKFALEGLLESMATYLEPFFKIKLSIIEPAGIKSDFVGRVQNDLQKTGGIKQDAYEPILKAYMQTAAKRGAFENSAQTPAQVAQCIVKEVQEPSGRLRIQTSAAAEKFCAEKLAADPDGTKQLLRIRRDLLGI